jgi:ATP-dependent RNA helicase DDX21
MPKWCLELSKEYMKAEHVFVDLVGEAKQKAVTTVRHLAIRAEWHQLGSTINDVIAMFCGREGRVLVFCSTKLDCDTIAMDKSIKHECHVLHGDIPQAKRESTLKAYQDKAFRVLIATDVAARGLDLAVELVINAKPPQKQLTFRADTETYVHRSGRTGRAGRSGICVTLYSHKSKPCLHEIETAVGNKFEWMGAPQPADILKGCAEQVVVAVAAVDPAVMPYFRDAARALVEQLGAEEALCAALAHISGYCEKPKERSLLGSSEGFVTVEFVSGKDIPAHGVVFGALQRAFGVDFTAAVRGMRLWADRTGACFDVPASLLPQVQEHIASLSGFKWLRLCTELPKLEEQRQREEQGGGGGRGGGGFGGGRGGGRGRSLGRGDGGRGGEGRGFGRAKGVGGDGGRGRGRGGDSAGAKRKFSQ